VGKRGRSPGSRERWKKRKRKKGGGEGEEEEAFIRNKKTQRSLSSKSQRGTEGEGREKGKR